MDCRFNCQWGGGKSSDGSWDIIIFEHDTQAESSGVWRIRLTEGIRGGWNVLLDLFSKSSPPCLVDTHLKSFDLFASSPALGGVAKGYTSKVKSKCNGYHYLVSPRFVRSLPASWRNRKAALHMQVPKARDQTSSSSSLTIRTRSLAHYLIILSFNSL